MKPLYLVACLLLSTNLWSQNPEFGPLVEITCGQNTVQQPDNWIIYHTTTNTWDGPIDTTTCISVANAGSTSLELEAGTYEPFRPVYARLQSAESMPLDPDNLYRFFTDTYSSNWNNTDWPEDGWANGCAVEITYPGNPDTGDEPTALWYDANFTYDPYWGSYSASNCVATHYVPGAEVTEFVLKLIFDESEVPFILSPYCDPLYDYNLITNDNIANWVNSWSEGSYVQFDWTTVITYDPAFGYPAATNPSFIDVYPEPNTSEQQVVQIEVSEYGGLTYQPFAFLRGGLLDGSTEDRHLLKIVNNSMSNCTNLFIEVVFPPGYSFVHMNGDYNLDPAGCMLFRRDATLEVAAGSTMNYGNLGAGMLGLFEGAHVVLNEGSTLRIDNTIALWELDWLTDTQEIVIPLPNGSLLEFGEYAKLAEVPDGFTIKLLMQGGSVDFGGLSPEERAVFELIWESETQAETLLFTQNPTDLPVALFENRSDADIHLQAYTTTGQLIIDQTLSLPRGAQSIALTSAQAAGVYIVRVEQAGKVWQGRVAVQ